MPKPETKAAAIGRLIRSAFVQANLGEANKALSLWQSAINKGYEPNQKTEKGLIIAIKKGLRDRGIE